MYACSHATPGVSAIPGAGDTQGVIDTAGEKLLLPTDSREDSFRQDEESAESLMVALTNHIRERDQREMERLLETASLEAALREDIRMDPTAPSNNQV